MICVTQYIIEIIRPYIRSKGHEATGAPGRAWGGS